MEKEFSLLKTTRENILKIITSSSHEQLVAVPKNFNNNLFWNYGHVIVTQQLLCYKLAKLDMSISNEIVARYKKGTKATEDFNQEDLNTFNELCFENITRIESDYQKGIFSSFEKYPTSYGFELNSIEDAIKFNNSHEALHLGYMMALKKSL